MPRKIINVGRVKGSMWYSGENFQEDVVNIKPLEGDFYLDTYTSLVHVYDGSQWRELINLTKYLTDGIISSTDNIIGAEVIDIATSDTYDEASEKQVPTSKAISDYIKKLRYETIIKEVRVITSLEKIYDSLNALQKVTDQPEGTIFVCKTNKKLPYVLYRWDATEQVWVYVDDVREGTIYYLLKDSSNFKAYTVLCFDGSNFKQLSSNDEEIKKLIPTKVSELTNDSGYIKNTVDNLTNYYLKNETYTKDEVLELIGQISTMSLEVVTGLPTENISLTTIYLKLSGNEEMNIYEEYIYVNNKWEMIGTTKVDLSNYVQKDEVMPIVEENSEEVETLLVGTSGNYDVESDEQVPTTKAVKQIVDEKLGDIQTLLEAI